MFSRELTAYLLSVEDRLKQAELSTIKARTKAEEERKRLSVTYRLAAIILATLLVGLAVSLWQMTRAMDAEKLAKTNEGNAITEREAKEKALLQATQQKVLAQEKEKEAKDELALSTAVTEFLQFDLLGQAASKAQADRKFEANPNLTIREALDRAATSVNEKFRDRPEVKASICQTLGVAYREVGQPEKAIAQFRQAADIRKGKLGSDHASTLTTLNSLAVSYLAAGRTAEAIALHEQVRDAKLKKLGLEHPDTLLTLGNLAGAYRAVGKTNEAIELLEKVRIGQMKNLGPDHASTLTTLHNLAVAYLSAQRATDAIALFEQVRDAKLKKYSPNHPDTLTTLHNLAVAYRSVGKITEAIALFEQVRDARMKILGADHPETLTTLDGLAAAYRNVGKIAESIALLEHVYDAQVKKRGPDHPETLITRNNLAVAYWQAKQLDKSIPLFEKVLAVQQQKLGPLHPNTLTTLANLGINLRDAGRLLEAIPLLEQAHREGRKSASMEWVGSHLLKTYILAGKSVEGCVLVKENLDAARKSMAAGSLHLAGALNQNGLALLQLKVWGEAEPILRECLAIYENLAPDDWTMFNTKSLLGEALLGQKKYDEAEPLLLAGYEGMTQRKKTIPPQGSTRLLEALDRLIQLYTETNKPDEVKKWQGERAKQQVPGTNPLEK